MMQRCGDKADVVEVVVKTKVHGQGVVPFHTFHRGKDQAGFTVQAAAGIFTGKVSELPRTQTIQIFHHFLDYNTVRNVMHLFYQMQNIVPNVE